MAGQACGKKPALRMCCVLRRCACPCRILYNNVVSIFWNAFLSTLSHAPEIDSSGVIDFVNQQVDNLPHPLHERAAEFADSLYSATRPLHEQAALFGESFQLPERLRPMVRRLLRCSVPQSAAVAGP